MKKELSYLETIRMIDEIKRIFGAKNNRITLLKRISFAGIYLDDALNDGECRYLTESEEQLFTK